MESLYPVSFMAKSNWTKEENKKFEKALAIFDKETPDRWLNVAAMVPGKTVVDVIKQYRDLEDDLCEIEAGLVPIPMYLSDCVSLEFVDDCSSFDGVRKRSTTVRDHERKKGVPWTEDEHRQFVLGLLEYGKGDWRNISRNYVKTKTPTQVASHAQKYFMRQDSGGKDNRRRSSIHDITTETINLTDNAPSENSKISSLHQTDTQTSQKYVGEELVQGWDYPYTEAVGLIGSSHSNLFASSPYGMASSGPRLPEQNLYDIVHTKGHDSVFQILSSRYQIHG